jgi:hypothetical protein
MKGLGTLTQLEWFAMLLPFISLHYCDFRQQKQEQLASHLSPYVTAPTENGLSLANGDSLYFSIQCDDAIVLNAIGIKS